MCRCTPRCVGTEPVLGGELGNVGLAPAAWIAFARSRISSDCRSSLSFCCSSSWTVCHCWSAITWRFSSARFWLIIANVRGRWPPVTRSSSGGRTDNPRSRRPRRRRTAAARQARTRAVGTRRPDDRGLARPGPGAGRRSARGAESSDLEAGDLAKLLGGRAGALHPLRFTLTDPAGGLVGGYTVRSWLTGQVGSRPQRGGTQSVRAEDS